MGTYEFKSPLLERAAVPLGSFDPSRGLLGHVLVDGLVQFGPLLGRGRLIRDAGPLLGQLIRKRTVGESAQNLLPPAAKDRLALKV